MLSFAESTVVACGMHITRHVITRHLVTNQLDWQNGRLQFDFRASGNCVNTRPFAFHNDDTWSGLTVLSSLEEATNHKKKALVDEMSSPASE